MMDVSVGKNGRVYTYQKEMGHVDTSKKRRINTIKIVVAETTTNERVDTYKNGCVDTYKNRRVDTYKNGRVDTYKNGYIDTTLKRF